MYDVCRSGLVGDYAGSISSTHGRSGSTSATVSAELSLSTPALSSSLVHLSWVLSSLAGQPQTSLASVGERITIGNDLPAITKKLATKIRNKIRNWECVDLVELWPASDAAGDTYPSGPPSAHFPLFPGCEIPRSTR